MKKLTIALIAAAFLNSCGSGTPNCTDSDVVDLSYEIFEKDFSAPYKSLLIEAVTVNKWEKVKEDSGFIAQLKEQFLAETDWAPVYANDDSFLRKFYLEKNPELITQIENQAELIWEENVEYQLTSIRLDGVNDEIKKCECSAELEFKVDADGIDVELYRTRTVLYDAQNTEDELLVWFDFEN